jgi:ribosomal protein S3AE
MYKIEIEWKEYYYETLEEAQKVASRMYEVTGNRHAISEVRKDEMKKYKKYIFRVEQYADYPVVAESEEQAWEIMSDADLSELKPEEMEWNMVDVVEEVGDDD